MIVNKIAIASEKAMSPMEKIKVLVKRMGPGETDIEKFVGAPEIFGYINLNRETRIFAEALVKYLNTVRAWDNPRYKRFMRSFKLKDLEYLNDAEYEQFVKFLVENMPYNFREKEEVDKAYFKLFDEKYANGKGADTVDDRDDEEYLTSPVFGVQATRSDMPSMATATLGAPWIRKILTDREFKMYAILGAPIIEAIFWVMPVYFGVGTVLSAGAIFTTLHLLNLFGEKALQGKEKIPSFILPALVVSAGTSLLCSFGISTPVLLISNMVIHAIVNTAVIFMHDRKVKQLSANSGKNVLEEQSPILIKIEPVKNIKDILKNLGPTQPILKAIEPPKIDISVLVDKEKITFYQAVARYLDGPGIKDKKKYRKFFESGAESGDLRDLQELDDDEYVRFIKFLVQHRPHGWENRQDVDNAYRELIEKEFADGKGTDTFDNWDDDDDEYLATPTSGVPDMSYATAMSFPDAQPLEAGRVWGLPVLPMDVDRFSIPNIPSQTETGAGPRGQTALEQIADIVNTPEKDGRFNDDTLSEILMRVLNKSGLAGWIDPRKAPVTGYRAGERVIPVKAKDEALYIDPNFLRDFNDIRKQNVSFKWVFPDGEKRIVSLHKGLAYLALRKILRWKSGGYFYRDGCKVKVEPDEYVNSRISGSYSLIDEAMWMWYSLSYCSGDTTIQYSNKAFAERIDEVYRGEDRSGYVMARDFPIAAKSEEARKEIKTLALRINKVFFHNFNITGKYGAIDPAYEGARFEGGEIQVSEKGGAKSRDLARLLAQTFNELKKHVSIENLYLPQAPMEIKVVENFARGTPSVMMKSVGYSGDIFLLIDKTFIEEIAANIDKHEDAARWVLMERLAHELGHSDDPFADVHKEHLRITETIDLPLYKKMRQIPGLSGRIDKFFRQARPTFRSSSYFQNVLKPLSIISMRDLTGEIARNLGERLRYPKMQASSQNVPKRFPDAGGKDKNSIRTKIGRWIREQKKKSLINDARTDIEAWVGSEACPEDTRKSVREALEAFLSAIQKEAISFDPATAREDTKDLFFSIAKSTDSLASIVYESLRDLCVAARKGPSTYKELIDIKLLAAIAGHITSGKSKARIYGALNYLCTTATKDNKGIFKELVDPELLITIAENTCIRNGMNFLDQTRSAYIKLTDLCEAAAKDRTGVFQELVNIGLLSTITKSAKSRTPDAYEELKKICNVAAQDATGAYKRLLSRELLDIVARSALIDTEYAYQCLNFLCSAGRGMTGDFQEFIDIEFLTAIAQNSGEQAGEAYSALGRIIEEVNKGTLGMLDATGEQYGYLFAALSKFLKDIKDSGDIKKYENYITLFIKIIPHNCEFKKEVDKAYQEIFDQQFPDGEGADPLSGDGREEGLAMPNLGALPVTGRDMSAVAVMPFPDATEEPDFAAIQAEIEGWMGGKYNKSFKESAQKALNEFFFAIQNGTIIYDPGSIKKDSENLFFLIDKNAGFYKNYAHEALDALCEKAKEDKTGVCKELLSINLLSTIVKSVPKSEFRKIDKTYNALRELCEAATKDETGTYGKLLNIGLLTTIAQKNEHTPYTSYYALRFLCESVAKDTAGACRYLLSTELLETIAERFHGNPKAYNALGYLYMAAVNGGVTGLTAENVEKLIIALGKDQDGFFYTALGDLCKKAAKDNTGTYGKLLSIEILIAIAENYAIIKDLAYKHLGSICENAAGDKTGTYRDLLNTELLLAISKNNERKTDSMYEALANILSAGNDGTLETLDATGEEYGYLFAALSKFLKDIKESGDIKKYENYITMFIKIFPHGSEFGKEVDEIYYNMIDKTFPDSKGPDETKDGWEDLAVPVLGAPTAKLDMAGVTAMPFPDAGEDINVTEKESDLFDKINDEINNTRDKLVACGNEIQKYIYKVKPDRYPSGVTAINWDSRTDIVRDRLEAVLGDLKWFRENNSGEVIGTIEKMEKFINENIYKLESYRIISSLMVLARDAQRKGQPLIVGIETDWIPECAKPDEVKSDMAGLIKEIRSLDATLHKMGLKNIEIVYSKKGDELAGGLKKAMKEKSAKPSNVIVIAGNDTMKRIKGDVELNLCPGEGNNDWAFFVGIDASGLDNKKIAAQAELKKYPLVRITRMIALALELRAIIKENYGELPGFAEYNRELNEIILNLSEMEFYEVETLKVEYIRNRKAFAIKA
ncbi:MAG: hypothetical protein PHW46_01945 [Candidatus Omnitrophica bacterium]|nr:hypothetical protein [Candidatus Omnitrophota bacterium]